MPRLPIPGQDDGQWGSILNEYLSQTHAGDGTLKQDSVGSAQLQDNAVTDSVLASNAVTTEKISDAVVTKAKLAPSVQVSLDNADSALQAAPVSSVAGRIGDVTISKTDVGLSNVDNTSDANKPVSSATQTALDAKANVTDIYSKVEADARYATAAQGTAGQAAHDEQTTGRLTDSSLSTKVNEAVAVEVANRAPGAELAYMEITTNWTNTATAAGTFHPSWLIQIPGNGRPVDIELHVPSGAYHSVASTGVVLYLQNSTTVISATTITSPRTDRGDGTITLKRRIVIPSGTNYGVVVGMYGLAAGTNTLIASNNARAYLSAVSR